MLKTWKISLSGNKYLIEPQKDLSGRLTLDKVNLKLPDGVYTTFRTYNRKQALGLENHFERLKESALLSGFEATFDNDLLRSGLRKILTYGLSDLEYRIRISLIVKKAVEFFVSIEPLKLLPGEVCQSGVKVISKIFQRSNARAKSTQFITSASAIRRSLAPDINEMIMLDTTGHFLEGLSSNFFAVINGVVWTANEKVLLGLTRQLVLNVIEHEGIPINLSAPHKSALIQEAFLTSVSRGVLPISQIDERLLPLPGKITKQISSEYLRYLESCLEDI